MPKAEVYAFPVQKHGINQAVRKEVLKQLRQMHDIEEKTLSEILRVSWDRKTCTPSLRSRWSRANPGFGQSAPTALVVQRFLPGQILRYHLKDGSCLYVNVIDDYGKIFDFTDQFDRNNVLPLPPQPVSRQWLFSAIRRRRYLILRNRVMLQTFGALVVSNFASADK
jgi:hypothetical protein